MLTYFIQAVRGGPVKIGRSSEQSVERRLVDLQCANPEPLRIVATIDGNHEARFHSMWRRHRIAGEWFMPVEAMVAHAPALLLEDHRVGGDAAQAAHEAYIQGWNDALDNVAKQLVAEAITEITHVVSDLAADLHKTPNLPNVFALRSRDVAPVRKEA